MPRTTWADIVQRWLDAHDPEDTVADANNVLDEDGTCPCCGVDFTEAAR